MPVQICMSVYGDGILERQDLYFQWGNQFEGLVQLPYFRAVVFNLLLQNRKGFLCKKKKSMQLLKTV